MQKIENRKCVVSEEMKTPDCLTAKLDILLEHLAPCTTDDSWFQHKAANLEIILILNFRYIHTSAHSLRSMYCIFEDNISQPVKT